MNQTQKILIFKIYILAKNQLFFFQINNKRDKNLMFLIKTINNNKS